MGISEQGVRSGSEEADTEYWRALSDGRRRRVLAILREQGQPMTLFGLSHRLVDASQGPAPEEARQLQMDLYHRHLPKLDDAGLVEFDPDEKRVAPTERALEMDW